MSLQNIAVYVNGVLQPVDELMITQTHVYFRYAPPIGSEVTLISTLGTNSFQADGASRKFRHSEGLNGIFRTTSIMSRATKHIDHPGVQDLMSQLEVLIDLLDEE
jgi:hypothetical protein